MRGPFRLFAMLRPALSVLPSMTAKFGGLVIICAAFLIAFAVITGIAGDMVGAMRAEVAGWRQSAEAENEIASTANAAADAEQDMIKAITNPANNARFENPSASAAGASVPKGEILSRMELVLIPRISPENQSGFRKDFEEKIVNKCNDRCTLDDLIPALSDGSIGQVFNKWGFPPDKPSRGAFIGYVLMSDQLGFNVVRSKSE